MARREAVNDTEHLAVPTRPEPPMPAPDAPSDENGIDELLRPLDALLAKLRTGSTGDQLVAIQRVHEIVWRGAEQNRLHDELRTMGALELMVTLVQSPNLLVRRESLHILWSLSSSARNARALVDMPGALDAIVRLLPARRTASKAGLLARTQLDETGASEASRVEILAPAAVATLRNVALQRGAPAQLVRAGAVGGLLRLLLGVDLDDVELVDVLLVLWRLSASPDEGESIRTVGSGAPRNTRFVIGKDGSGGEDSGAVDAGAAAGAAPPIASASGCETVGAVASPETRARADGVDADVAADDCAAAVTAHALAEMRADSVLARLSGLAVRTAVKTQTIAAERRRRPAAHAAAAAAAAVPHADVAAADEDSEPSTANAIVCALIANLATTEDVAERAGALDAIDGVSWSLRAALSAGVRPDSVTSAQLHSAWALANLLALSKANCVLCATEHADDALPALAQLLHYAEPPQRLLPPDAAARMQARDRARHKAALALRHVVQAAPDMTPLRTPALVRSLVGLLAHRATSACHALALCTLADLAGGRDAPTRAMLSAGGAGGAGDADALAAARAIAEAGAMDHLRFTLLSADRAVLEGSLQLLGTLAALPHVAAALVPAVASGANDAEPRMDVGSPSTLDTLLALLARGANDRRIVRHVLHAMRTLLLAAPPLRDVVGARAAAADLLLHLTVSADDRTQLWAVSTLHMLARENAIGAETVRACGGIPTLLELLRPAFPSAVRDQAAQALDEVCRLCTRAPMEVDKAGGSVRLADAMSVLHRDFRTPPFF
ncbi:hypothetical protein KFE25_003106 [Diacronema lutheri]|uniref:Uncharacterized protein n=1 Tax=Diacronema lutheri TaxID=2081491 RepID=A0A8J6C4S7_DIALT|nr:hypothetical protein KFE25_003106 [Diacronema lutheri]